MKLFNRYFSAYHLLLLLGDITLTVLATVAARFLMVLARVSDVASWHQWMILAWMIVVFIVVSFYYADLYAVDQTLSERELMLRFANGFGIACLIIGGVSYPIQEPGSKNIYLIEMLLMGIGLFGWRVVFTMMLKRRKIHGTIVVVGTQAIGRLVAEELCKQRHLGMEVAGFIGSQAGQITLSYGNPRRISIPVLPGHATLGFVEAKGVNRILVAGAESGAEFPAQELVSLRLKGIPIEDCHTFYERLMSKISIVDLQPGWIALSKGFRRTRWILLAKRAIDIVVSMLGLVLATPLALLTAIAIKLDSPGPVLYRQQRVGQNGRLFNLYKFRSMFHGAEAETGPVWTTAKDPRVTRVGRMMRQLRIDEIPQMFNVLKGEMSFVGPRPERPFFVSRLKERVPYYHLRFSIKPGITGWAQISYPYGDSEEDAAEKLQYDLYYVKHMSPIFDLQILFETVKVILFGKGAQ
jgi:sugar transferase (PEP-CTERM system associated)